MRYAVTKAPDARENAKAAFHALLVLQQATGTSHFIARSVLPIGTSVPPPGPYLLAVGDLRKKKNFTTLARARFARAA